MWTQSVPLGQPLPDDASQPKFQEDQLATSWPQDTMSGSDNIHGLECSGLFDDTAASYPYFPESMMLTQTGLAEHDNFYSPPDSDAMNRLGNSRLGSMHQFIAPCQTQRSAPASNGTPPLTEASSPTLDGGRSAVESAVSRPAYALPNSWAGEWSTQDQTAAFTSAGQNEPAYTTTAAPYMPSTVPNSTGPCPVHTQFIPKTIPSSQQYTSDEQRSERSAHTYTPEPNSQSESVQQNEAKVSKPAGQVTVPADSGPGRKGKLYEAKPSRDGYYHCPYRAANKCTHDKTKLKCNYDKYIDSHLKPYRCVFAGCGENRFSSTACRLRHEREAHGSHGHGVKPYLCKYPDCDRSKPGNGFPRCWNRNDHMKRVHDHNVDKASASPKAAETDFGAMQPAALQSRKRSAADDDAGEMVKRRKISSPATEYGMVLPSNNMFAQPGADMQVPFGMMDMPHDRFRQCQERLAFYSQAQNIKSPQDVELINQASVEMLHFNFPTSMPRS